MPRIRSIKPQFWLDENLGGISRDARLLYIGLWNLSDDQGVFEWRPARIKIQLFPYDDDITAKEIEEWLNLLTDTEDIARFEHDGHKFGYIRSFLEHQEIKKPSQWIFAPIPEELKNSSPLVGEELPTSSPPVPLGSREGGKGKGVGNKEKITTTSSSNIFQLFEQEIGRLTPLITDELREAEKIYSEDWIKDAIREAVKANKRNWRYIAGILENWQKEGRQGRPKKDDPDKFIKGKYGHIVKR